MAAPSRRAETAPVAGLSTTSPAGTQVGDLVVVFTWERAGAGIPTHTLQAGFVEILSHSHNDGSTDGRLSVAGKIATAAGAASYQAYTSSVGTETWTGCYVVQTGTFGLDAIEAASVTATGTGAPDPPNVTLDSTRDWLVLAISAWHLTASQTLTPTAPTNYTLRADVAGAATGDVAVSDRALTAAASENPGAYADNQTPNGTCSITVGIPNPPAADGGWTLRQLVSFVPGGTGSTVAVNIWPRLAGSLLTACIRNDSAQTISSVADDDGNTWQNAVTNGGNPERVTIRYAENVAAGNNGEAVTVTFSASTGSRVLVVCEWVGAETSGALDGTNSKVNASTTTPDSNSVTASADGHLYLGFLTSNSSAFSTTPGAGYVELFDHTPTGCQVEYDVQASAASKNATWTISVADDATGCVAVFKVAAGGTQFNETPSDTLALSEADQLQARKALGEVLALTEDQTVQSRKTILEAVALTESLRRVITHPLAETLSLSENLGAIKVVLRGVSDTLSLTEQLRLAVTKVNGLADTIGLSETLAKRPSKTVAETLQLTENLTAIKLIIRNLPETLSLTEQLQLAARKQASIAETLSLTETLARETRKNLTDTVAITENLGTLKFILRPLADTLLLSENLTLLVRKSQSIAETVLLSEAQARQTNKTFAETVSLTENLTALKAVLATRADALSLNETLTRLVRRATAETVSLTETDTATVRKTIAELAAFTEQLVTSVIKTKALSDNVLLTETLRRQVGKAVQDTLGLTETHIVRIAKSFQEQVNLAEEFLAFFIPAGGFVELVQIIAPTYQIGRATMEAFAVAGATAETMRAGRVQAEVFATAGLLPGAGRVPGATAETYGASS
ncbi:MAG TPA: hypothetical protein VKA83_09350 [Methylomirabilota bacterium]|nr:hypothetical protein [Methylomirabilota bacterium]